MLLVSFLQFEGKCALILDGKAILATPFLSCLIPSRDSRISLTGSRTAGFSRFFQLRQLISGKEKLAISMAVFITALLRAVLPKPTCTACLDVLKTLYIVFACVFQVSQESLCWESVEK